MPTWTELAPYLVLGLLGSLHCVGMCGGFAFLVVSRARSGSRVSFVTHQAAYGIGKALTYAVLGVGAALASRALLDSGEELLSFHGLRRVFAWGVGLALIVAGLAHLGIGWKPAAARSSALTSWMHRLQGLFAGLRALPGVAGTFGVGALTGLLPCGLSWSAVLLASQGELGVALAGPFLFGLATLPALALTALLGHGFRGRAGLWSRRLVGPALLVLGALTLFRGLPGGADGAACCSDAAHAGVAEPALSDQVRRSVPNRAQPPN